MEQNQNPTNGSTNTPEPNKPQSPTNVGTTANAPKQEQGATPDHNLNVNPVVAAKLNPAISHRVNIRCSIRRKPYNGGLPGSDPADRRFKIGASFNAVSKKALKGVDGKLETIIMPKIIGIASNEHNFQREVDDYWNNIGVLIPADEDAPKEEDKGKVLNIDFIVQGSLLKESLDSETNIETKYAILSKGIVDGTITIDSDDSYFDFAFLGYILRNKEVANDASLMWYSPKIKYYVYNKAISTAKKYNIIELKDTARPLFAEIKTDDNKLNAILMMFNLLPSAYPTTMDKVIALDEVYDKTEESLRKFIEFARDSDLDLKYLVKLASKKNKITNHTGTEAYYYNQILLGKTLNDTVLFLKDLQPENQNIRKALEREVKD